MMKRKIISIKKLAAWCTKEIRRFDGCENIELNVQELQEPDLEGLNWCISDYIRATDVPPEVWKPALITVLTEAREQFDIPKPD